MEYRYNEDFIGYCPVSNDYETITIEFVEFPNTHLVGRKAMKMDCPIGFKCPNPNECPIYLKIVKSF